MKHISRYILTLVALFAMTTGAWADPNILAPTITGDREFYESVEVTMICTSPNADIYYTVNGKDPKTLPDNQQIEYKDPITLTETTTIMARAFDGNDWSAMVEVTFTKQTGPKVTWDAATKTGTFTMPAYDVEIAPIYAPVAQWAKDKEVDQIPAAIEGIFAGTTDAIVKAGTVATAGTTENPQGLVMYAVTTTNTTAPALSAFSSELPTAADIADDGATVYVWYYIAGADTPDGQEATAENTFNDSEICAQPLEVIVLSNKFDITFNAANANTIEAGKATVKVGDAAATVTEGKLEGVKMGSEVKMTAKDGYKFKKVEAKKKASTVPVTAITLNKTATTITKISGTATETLSVTAVTPDEATDKTYTWSSDDITKATVDQNGVVTAVAEGTAHIRATANDGSGVYGECTVTVSDLSAYYSKMVECGCDMLDGKCWNGGSNTFTGQVLSAAQAIALAQAKAAETSSNCAVFYGGEMGQVKFAKNDGTTGSAKFYYDASGKGLTGYRGFYVSK